MHIITPYNPWAPKKKKTWQEELWEQQAIAEAEAQMLAEASSRTLPPNSPDISVATAGPAVNAPAGAGNAPVAGWFRAQTVAAVPTIAFAATPGSAGPAPFSVTFLNMSSPDALNFWTWNWNMNDGTPNHTEKNPFHTFTQTGSYRVSLTGSAPNGTIVTQSVVILAVSASRPNMPLVPILVPTQVSGTVPMTVQFANRTPLYASVANVYKWTFSGSLGGYLGVDGALSYPITTSAVTEPSITFYRTGSYSVKLETTGSWDTSGSVFYLMAVSASA